MFEVQKNSCSSCIYRKDSTLDIKKLEKAVSDKQGGFITFRECHHAKKGSDVCCRGFWNKHKDKFNLGRIAQRLGVVKFVEVDVLDNKREVTND